MSDRYTFSELCQTLGKSRADITGLQKTLGIHVPPREVGYSGAYLNFMQKIVALRSFTVPLQDIRDLFQKERKILELLHVDSLATSPTWYLDACDQERPSPTRLLLTGYDLGFPLGSGILQSNLNFGPRHPELFNSREMGEDIRRVMGPYLELVKSIKERVRSEERVLENALSWSEEAFDA